MFTIVAWFLVAVISLTFGYFMVKFLRSESKRVEERLRIDYEQLQLNEELLQKKKLLVELRMEKEQSEQAERDRILRDIHAALYLPKPKQ